MRAGRAGPELLQVPSVFARDPGGQDEGARIEAGGERAYYRPSTDTIHMPDEGLFTGTDTMNRSEAWYATALHETTHYAAFRIMPRRCAILRTGVQRQRGMSA